MRLVPKGESDEKRGDYLVRIRHGEAKSLMLMLFSRFGHL